MRTKIKSDSSRYIPDSEVLYLRTSLLKAYLRCPAQCFFRYFKGLVILPRSYLMMGSCFHKTVEHHYKYKKQKGKNEKLSTLQDIFHEEFKASRPRTQWLKSEKPDDFDTEGTKLIVPTYYKERAVKLEPKYVEEGFKLFIPEVNAYVTGTLDLILTDDSIRDHKTRSRRPNWMDAMKSFQGLSYTAGHVEKFGEFPKDFKLDYILRGKHSTEIELSKPVKHTKSDIEGFKILVARVVRSMRRGEFYPHCEGNFLCSPNMCGFWYICQKKGQWKDLGVFTQVFGKNSGEEEKGEE